MAKNSVLFYISGFISLLLFVAFLFMFLFMIFKSSKIKTYALHKDRYVSVSIQLPKKSTKVSKKNLTQPVVKEIEKTRSVQTKNVDIGNLFSNVWTKKIKLSNQKKKIDNKRVQNIEKRLKTKTTNEINPVSKKLQNIEKIESKDSNVKSTASEVNEYLAKIQGLVYSHFNPPKNSEGNEVVAYIELGPFGKVIKFKILTYSSNDALNKECDKIKTRLMNVIFPVNPQNKPYSGKIRIISKE